MTEADPALKRYEYTTKRNKLQSVSIITKAAKRYYSLPYDPFDGITITDDRNNAQRSAGKRTSFRTGELILIRDELKSRIGKERRGDEGKMEEAYWLFVGGAYLGFRREEFAQILTTDVDIERRTIVIADDEHGYKRVKNDNSVRVVPIHPAMIAGGFLEFVQRRANNKLLFAPDERIAWKVSKGGRAVGDMIAKRIDEAMRRAKIRQNADGRKITAFHSLRHTWEDLARDCGMRLTIRRQIGGRQMDDDPTQAGYGAGGMLLSKRKAIALIDPFREGPFDPIILPTDTDQVDYEEIS